MVKRTSTEETKRNMLKDSQKTKLKIKNKNSSLLLSNSLRRSSLGKSSFGDKQ